MEQVFLRRGWAVGGGGFDEGRQNGCVGCKVLEILRGRRFFCIKRLFYKDDWSLWNTKRVVVEDFLIVF